MRIMFYKARAAFVLYINRILSKLLLVDNSPIFAAAAIIEREGKVLFIDHSYAKGIGLPGGVVKENENLEKALEREIFEETGLKIKESKYLGSFCTYLKGVPTASAVFVVKTSGVEKESNEGPLLWLEPNKAIGKFTYKDNEKAVLEYLRLNKNH